MDKLRVLFPYVEAGFGHIMPMKAIDQTFRRKYGDRVEVISSRFFTETGDPYMKEYEQMFSRQVRLYNHVPAMGYVASGVCQMAGADIASYGSMRLSSPRVYRASMQHMRELAPDVVFSTHWATNYYAEHLSKKPLTVMYCPDARLYKLFEYRCDLTLISMPYGYQQALRKKRYNVGNIKLVPFLIRNEAFAYLKDKKELRRDLGIPEENFTVVMAEGGYGIGKMAAISELLVREHLPLTVIPVCGKNEALYRHFQTLCPTKEVTFKPYGFTERILELEAAADLFCGKSGNMIAEVTFYGNPSVITKFSTSVEQNIADHYINTVGCAMKEFSPSKVVDMIKRFARDEALLEPYRKAARNYHGNFGSEKAADLLWETIVEQYPALQ